MLLWRRIAAFGVALVATTAVAPQSVEARSFVTIPGNGASAPVLLGDTVAWRGPLGDPVIHGDDGSGPREIGRLPSGLEHAGSAVGAGSEAIVLGGSAELVVVNHPHRCYSEACESVAVIAAETYTVVYAGRRGTPLKCLSDLFSFCSGHDPISEGIARVSGYVIAWPVNPDEVGPSLPPQTFVRDLRPGAAMPDRATVDLQDGRANGTWVAGVIAVTDEGKATEVVVMNWRTPGVMLRIPGLTSARVLSVEPDGTVVYATKVGDDRLAVFAASPDRPVARLITTTPDDAAAISAGGRVVRPTHEQDLSRRPTRPPASGILEAFDLEGRRVARVDEPALFGGFGSDGQRVSFVSKPCFVARVVVQELGEPPVARPEGRCPAARVVRALHWRGSSARLRIACTSATKLGCFGRVRLVARVRVGGRSRRRFVGHATYSLPAAARRTLRVYVKRPALRFLQAHPGARFTVTSVGAVPRGSHARPRSHITRLRLPRP